MEFSRKLYLQKLIKADGTKLKHLTEHFLQFHLRNWRFLMDCGTFGLVI